MLQQEYIPDLAGLVDQRGGPGILVLSLSGHVQYMNRRSWDLLRLMNRTTSVRTSSGLLPAAVAEMCRQISNLHRDGLETKDWDQIEIRHMAGGPQCPVLLRGVRLSGHDGSDHSRILIMMETVARRETSTHHAKERFQLTEREHSVVERLAKGWTNKEIAAELKITEPTVKAHIRHIMDKTKCTTRTGIVAQVLHA